MHPQSARNQPPFLQNCRGLCLFAPDSAAIDFFVELPMVLFQMCWNWRYFFCRSSFVRYAIWIISKKFSSNYHMLMPSPPSTTPCKGEDKAGWFGGQMDPVWGKQWTLWTLKPTKWEKKNCFNHYRVVLSRFIMKIYHPIAKDDRIIVDQPF